MKKILTFVIAFVFVIGLGTAHATTIDFQTSPDTYDSLTGDFTYGDVTFSGWKIMGDFADPTDQVAIQFAWGTTTATISFNSPVDISEFQFQFDNTKLYVNTDPVDVLGLVLPVTMDNYTGYWSSLGIDLTNVTKLTFVTTGGLAYIDDIKYSATPIPGAAWLLGSGLIGLVGLRRKFLA